MPTVIGQVLNPGEIGVLGESAQFEGVRGVSHAGDHGAVVGINDNPTDTAGPGVFGESTKGEGVRGVSHSPVHGGVVGTCDNEGAGVFGESTRGEGVRGVSHSPVHGGVVGTCDNEGAGVFGESTKGEGVRGVSHSPAHAAVVGTNDNAAGIGVFGKGGRLAGFFEGHIEVTGSIVFQGLDLLHLIDQLRGEVADLRQRLPVSTGVGQSKPRITSVSVRDGKFIISAEGLQPNRLATILVNDDSSVAPLFSVGATTDGSGRLTNIEISTTSVGCASGQRRHFVASSDLNNSNLTSDRVTHTCP